MSGYGGGRNGDWKRTLERWVEARSPLSSLDRKSARSLLLELLLLLLAVEGGFACSSLRVFSPLQQSISGVGQMVSLISLEVRSL